MIAHAAGIMLDEITTTYDKWVTPNERKSAKGVIAAGQRRGRPVHDQRRVQGRDPNPARTRQPDRRRRRTDWPTGNQNDVYRVDIEGTPSIFQETAFRFTDGSGRDAAAAGCLSTGLRALNAVPAVNDLSPGWVTALDLPLIPGVGDDPLSNANGRRIGWISDSVLIETGNDV